jgi:hypothetical protein
MTSPQSLVPMLRQRGKEAWKLSSLPWLLDCSSWLRRGTIQRRDSESPANA